MGCPGLPHRCRGRQVRIAPGEVVDQLGEWRQVDGWLVVDRSGRQVCLLVADMSDWSRGRSVRYVVQIALVAFVARGSATFWAMATISPGGLAPDIRTRLRSAQA